MTIYILDQDVTKCAQALDNRSLDKMISDIVQVLCSVARMETLVPSSVPTMKHIESKNILYNWVNWTQECKSNYLWLVELGLKLDDEYTFRHYAYGKPDQHHKFLKILLWARDNVPDLPYECGDNRPKLPLIMPEKHKYNKIEIILDAIDGSDINTISAYRNYYQAKLDQHLKKFKHYDYLCWTNRQKPEWLEL